MNDICILPSFIQYPPYQHEAVYYDINKLDRDIENNKKRHFINLFFKNKHGIAAIAVEALSANDPERLDWMSIQVDFTSFIEFDRGTLTIFQYGTNEELTQLQDYFASLGTPNQKQWNVIQFSFDNASQEQNKTNQEKAEAFLLFLSANVGAAAVNLIKDTIGFKDCANPERVNMLATQPEKVVKPQPTPKAQPKREHTSHNCFFHKAKTKMQDFFHCTSVNPTSQLKQ